MSASPLSDPRRTGPDTAEDRSPRSGAPSAAPAARRAVFGPRTAGTPGGSPGAPPTGRAAPQPPEPAARPGPPVTPAWRAWPAEAGVLVPGLVLTAAAVALSLAVGRLLSGVSPAMIAVACGVALTNLGGTRAPFLPGLRFVSRRMLRLAIVMLGLQIALPEVLALGWRTLVVILAATGGTFLITRRLGGPLGVGPRRSLLIATGVSVCGAAAVAAMHEVAGSDDDDVASALSVVVLYGSAAMVVLPALAGPLGLTPSRLGLWAGASIHEVAQVAAVGAAAGTGALASAVVVKLARVVLLAPMVALTSLTPRRAGGPPAAPAGRRPPVIPLFVLGFLTAVAVRSLGLVPAGAAEAVPQVTGILLAAALFGLGTGVNLRELLRGGRPLLLGGAATAVIGGISLIGILVIG